MYILHRCVFILNTVSFLDVTSMIHVPGVTYHYLPVLYLCHFFVTPATLNQNTSFTLRI